MFSSTIIPTVGRSTLSRAVNSVLGQELPEGDFEVIVVNDSGRDLPSFDWLDSPRVQVLHTQRRERSVARNTGAAIARGKYLHFLDDDDWLLPGAFAGLWKLAQERPDAVWLYGGFNFVDAGGNLLQACHPDEEGNCLVRLVASEWLPIQVSLIRSDAFFATMGFEPAMIPFQDNDLARQVALLGDFAVAPIPVANIVRSDQDTTTDYSRLSHNTRWSREKVLDYPGAFTRIRRSARSRPVNPAYWQGRITAAYLGSVSWNLVRRRYLTALGRIVYGLGNIVLTGLPSFTPSFWRGAARSHQTRGFLSRHGID